MTEAKQCSVLGNLFLSGSRLRPVIGVIILVLGMQDHALAQSASISDAQAAALKKADDLDKQGKEHLKKAEYDAALASFKKALQVRQKALGMNHLSATDSMGSVAELYGCKSKHIPSAAAPVAPVAAIRQSTLSKDIYQSAAESLNNLGMVHRLKGDYAHALLLYECSLAIREKSLGTEHPDTAISLNNVALLHHVKGDYKQALSLYQRSLAIKVKALGNHHLSVANSLNNLAELYREAGDYEHALPLYEQALAITGESLGKRNLKAAVLLNNLALLHQAKGYYDRALPLYERSLSIMKEKLGKHHPSVATSLNNLALLHKQKGNYEQALLFYERSLAIQEQALGRNHPDVASSRNNLAELHRARGDYEHALPLYESALTVVEKKLGKNHPMAATLMNNLAILRHMEGDHKRALPLYERSLAIREQSLGKNSRDVAQSLNNIAELHRENGDYERALRLHDRSWSIRHKVLGPHHPDTAQSLNNRAKLHWAQGRERQAATYLQQAMDAREVHISLATSYDLSRHKRMFLTKYSGDIDVITSFALQYKQPQAKRLALNTLLSRKGRVSDSMSNVFATVRRRLGHDEQVLFDEYRSNRTIYARQLLRGPGRIHREQHQKNLEQLQQRAHELEQIIAKRSSGFSNQLKPVTVDAVQTILPAGSMLVEWMRYRTYDPKKLHKNALGEKRYAASILGKTGDPEWIDLGKAEPIDKLIKEWRSALARRLINADELARQLDGLVMAPVRAHLGDATHVFLSPDSSLNLIPFAALVDEQGRHLVERYLFTYLTSGRDLLRIDQYKDAKAQSPALIVADPQYNIPGAPAVWGMQPLFNVMAEAKEVQNVFPNATLLTGNQATEKALKEVRGPAIVHLATHGYFSPTTCGENDSEVDHPSLRSGVALAGANACRSPDDDNDDGLLTALEAASIDLYGTELAVLSACDTGVGGTELYDDFLNKDIGRGDGVQGLRRALVLAGAKTQMVSLWPVDNIKTRKLMTAYYGKLAEGKGRSEALREVQLAFMQDKELSHPNAWAAFIVSGDSSPLNLPMAKPHPGKVRGPRGCACDVTSADGPAWPGGVLLALLTLGLLHGMRRRLA